MFLLGLFGVYIELKYQFHLQIMLQITQHKWAWPFMQPVDVEALGLRDYYEVLFFSISFAVFILHMFEFLIGMLTCSILKLGKGSFVISVRKPIRDY